MMIHIINHQSKLTRVAWRHHFPIISLLDTFRHSRAANSIVSCLILAKFKLFRDFMHVLKSCKLKRTGSISTKKRWRRGYFRHSRAANSVVSGRIWLTESKLIQALMHVLITCKFQKNWTKTTEKKWRQRFPHYKSMGGYLYTFMSR